MAATIHAPAESPLSTQDLEEQIRRRAHQIWLENGSPAGTDLIDWLEAEQEILNEQEDYSSAVAEGRKYHGKMLTLRCR